jgi:hypothetical protein
VPGGAHVEAFREAHLVQEPGRRVHEQDFRHLQLLLAVPTATVTLLMAKARGRIIRRMSPSQGDAVRARRAI